MKIAKNKGRAMTFILAGVLLVNTKGFAGSNIKTNLSLQEAIDVGIENSMGIELNKISLDKLKVELSEAKSMERKYDKYRKYTPIYGTTEGFMLEEEAATKGKRYAIEEATMKEEYIKNNLKSGITQVYYGVLQAKDALDIEKSTLKNLQENYDIVKKKLDVGTASKSELYMTEIALNEGRVKVDKAEDSYRAALRALNNLIDYPLESDLTLTSNYKEDDKSIDLEKDIEYALNNRYDLIVANNNKELVDLQFTVIKRSYTPNTYKYRTTEADVRTVETILKNKNKDIEADIRGKYDKIKTAREEINLMNANVEKAEEGLRLAKLSYDLGTGTSLSVSEAIVGLNQTQLGRANAVANYNVSLIEYDTAVKIGELM